MLVAIEFENVPVNVLLTLLPFQTSINVVKVLVKYFNFMSIVIRSISVIDVVVSIVYLVDIIDSQLYLSSINPFNEEKDFSSERFNRDELIRVDINLSLIAIFINED